MKVRKLHATQTGLVRPSTGITIAQRVSVTRWHVCIICIFIVAVKFRSRFYIYECLHEQLRVLQVIVIEMAMLLRVFVIKTVLLNAVFKRKFSMCFYVMVYIAIVK